MNIIKLNNTVNDKISTSKYTVTNNTKEFEYKKNIKYGQIVYNVNYRNKFLPQNKVPVILLHFNNRLH